jgi:hypothetical protein
MKTKNIFFVVFVSSIIISPLFVSAANIGLQNPLKVSSVPDLIYAIIDWFVIAVGPAIATIMIIYGAFQMLTAGGDPKKFEEGKKAILYAVVGYGIILVAEGVVLIIQKLLQ